MNDPFFTQESCDRCGEKIRYLRRMSWFTTECLCEDCIGEEDKVRVGLQEQGKNILDYEGCGRVPQV